MSIESSGALGPRAADGSMPAVDFLKLVAGSQMIDKGTSVDLPFAGAAPDLGAYEYGATATTTGTGGVSGTAEAPGRAARPRRALEASGPAARPPGTGGARVERRREIWLGRSRGNGRRRRRHDDDRHRRQDDDRRRRRRRDRRQRDGGHRRQPRRAPAERGRAERAAQRDRRRRAEGSASGCACAIDAPSANASLAISPGDAGRVVVSCFSSARRRATARP